MANEISSMTLANMPARPVKDSSQFAKLEGVPTPTAEQALPNSGKALPQQPANQAQLREAVDQINQYVQTVQRDLSFSMDGDSGETIIKVIDSGSGELIRQIPSVEVLALATYLQDVSKETPGSAEIAQGILFSEST